MPDIVYPDPVSRLLNLGDTQEAPTTLDWRNGPGWLDYPQQFGLKSEHIPDLIRMATDRDLNLADIELAKSWAPMHAWRALGQLKAVEAVQPLLDNFNFLDENDNELFIDDLPEALSLIGPAAIPPVAKYLADPGNRLWARISAAFSLEKIGAAHPQSRQECVDALTAVLQNYTRNDEMLNGELVNALAELKAVEAAPLVEQAYKADRVDESILGDWEDFQVAVGLLEERITPDEDLDFNPFIPSFLGEGGKGRVNKESAQTKKKRKQAKDSRRKNRKKKKK